jgi:hypothetical protein
MKNFLLLPAFALMILATGILFTGCEKSEDPSVRRPGQRPHPGAAGAGLIGDWKLFHVDEGGFAGGSWTPPADSSYILTLRSDSGFTNKVNGMMVSDGTYSIHFISNPGDPHPDTTLTFSNGPGYPYSVHINGDRLDLVLSTIEADPTLSYNRVR